MPITFNVIASSSTPAQPLTINPGATADDVLIGAAVLDDGTVTTFTPWPSFDQIANLNTQLQDGQSLGVFRKKDATGTEGAIDLNNAIPNNMIGFIMALSGADNVTPEDVASVTGIDDTNDPSPWDLDLSITPVTDGCMIVCIVGSDTIGSMNAVHSFSNVTGTALTWTVRGDFNSGFYNIAVATAPQAAAEAITVRGTGTFAGQGAAQAMVVMAIRPAAGAATLVHRGLLLGVGI
jgi:hypothetical protein